MSIAKRRQGDLHERVYLRCASYAHRAGLSGYLADVQFRKTP
jgi:hypothetical protein